MGTSYTAHTCVSRFCNVVDIHCAASTMSCSHKAIVDVVETIMLHADLRDVAHYLNQIHLFRFV